MTTWLLRFQGLCAKKTTLRSGITGGGSNKGQKFELNILNVGLEHPSRKNVLHCLKYFAAQSVNKELFPIFLKNFKN